ncbi:MAG TPA: hypothetical protein VGT44_07280 [Ktedonobacteraceae bacterium]|nr:hypothetical protein [Ktedonobacteraceae bacterium]
MRQHSSGFYLGIAAAIILGFGVVAGIVIGLRSDQGLGYEPNVLQAIKTGPNSATLQLATYPDSHVCHADAGALQYNWVTYCSGGSDPTAQGTTLEVPPNSVITVIIKQYDSATSLINDYFRQVRGTIGGVALLNNKPYSEVDATAPGHTFTLQSTPDSPYPIFVSVPLVGVKSGAAANVTINGSSYPTPNIISFQFKTGPAGITYIWHCYDPCGDSVFARKPPYGFSGPMSTTGFMAGTMTVASY